jgi:hypothetical protein
MRTARLALAGLVLATTVSGAEATEPPAESVPATVVSIGDSLTVRSTPVLQQKFSGPGFDYVTVFNAIGGTRATASEYWSPRLSPDGRVALAALLVAAVAGE